MLGIPSETTDFDTDILVYVNMAFDTLTILGVGPREGFRVTSSDQTWTDFYGEDKRFDMVQTYVYLRTKILFDSSTIPGSLLETYKTTVSEMEFYLNCMADPILLDTTI